jgi:FKBP-type peptidyl-prolyl cis-trans isomerase
MKKNSLYSVLAVATALTSISACAATEPTKPAASDAQPAATKPAATAATAAPLPIAEAAPLRLAPSQPLPKALTQLTIIEREAGDTTSPLTVAGSPILVHYTGWIYDPSKPDGKGTQFDS